MWFAERNIVISLVSLDKDKAKSVFKMGYPRKIALGFLCVIIIGTVLLSLPISTKDRTATNFVDSFFTAVSASCVTGLVVYDTFAHWSLFGQLVILTMIQIGGLGFIALIVSFYFFTNKKIGLETRGLVMESLNGMQLSGIVRLARLMIVGSLVVELLGAVLLSFRFIPQFGLLNGIYTSVFISISAFCNAGFDILGVNGQFSSLTSYNDDPYILSIIMVLIILGGLGFFVWSDLIKNKFNFKSYSLHSKLVITVSAFLIAFGAVYFFIVEYNHSLEGMSIVDKLFNSLFGAVTPRTAGFNSVDQTTFSAGGQTITTLLMAVGGSPGSTAGGLKTVTLAVLFISLRKTLRPNKGDSYFGRSIEDGIEKKAFSIAAIYFSLIIFGCLVLSALLPSEPLDKVVFEIFSAMGTIGLSLGTTSALTVPAKLVVAFLMFCGRVGSLTFIMIFKDAVQVQTGLTRPKEKVSVG